MGLSQLVDTRAHLRRKRAQARPEGPQKAMKYLPSLLLKFTRRRIRTVLRPSYRHFPMALIRNILTRCCVALLKASSIWTRCSVSGGAVISCQINRAAIGYAQRLPNKRNGLSPRKCGTWSPGMRRRARHQTMRNGVPRWRKAWIVVPIPLPLMAACRCGEMRQR